MEIVEGDTLRAIMRSARTIDRATAVNGNQFDAKISDHGCRIDYGTGAVWCWGRNDEHQLGDGTGRNSHVPRQVRSP
jgi:hypothetical protein